MEDSIENEELFEHFHFTADAGQEPLRIDKFLMDRVMNATRNKIQSAAKNGNVFVNDEPVKPNYKVKAGDDVRIKFPYPINETEVLPEKMDLNILFEDDTVIVLNKPAGLVVHPGHGNYTGTLVNGLLHHFKSLPDQSEFGNRPGLVHRLDKDTSGIMVIAKTEAALSHLSKQFFDRTSERRYHALVWGDFEENEGSVEGHIGRSLKNRKVMQVFPDGEFGKSAKTHFSILQRFGYVSLVECKLETGRTHQIRAHFKFIGHPLFSDETYGGNRIMKGTTSSKYKQFVENCFKLCPRQALHAKTLGFTHPKTGEWMQFDSDIPEDMQALIEKWDHYAQHAKELQ
jgi:23S rRNA pseudouridine1911/1915/1917 synthase